MMVGSHITLNSYGLVLMTNNKEKICARCKSRLRIKKTGGKCIECALEVGYKQCFRCKRVFNPVRKNQRTCGKCVPKKGKSVWIVGSAGLPSLGKKK
jgi:methionyl-tRNA synthetase